MRDAQAGAMLRPPSLACYSHATLGASLPDLACPSLIGVRLKARLS